MSGPTIPSTVMGATVVDVSTRKVNTKYGEKNVWAVLTQDGTKWETWKNDLGNQAMALKGQLADLKVEISQNGDFTNYNLIQIRPAAGPAVATAAAEAQAAQPALPVSYEQYKSNDQEKEDRKNLSIHRQVAAKVAAQLSSDMTEFWANVNALVTYFGTGLNPLTTEATVTSHGDPGPSEPSWEQQTTENSQDDDIPF